MLLIIPAIEIKNGKCSRGVQGFEGHVTTHDPVEMARLWRKENAKSLHVTDIDGLSDGKIVNTDVIGEIVKAVDIPIELGGALTTFEEIEKAAALGMYRITVHPSMMRDRKLFSECITSFGPSKIVLGIVIPAANKESAEREAITTVTNAREAGIKRVLYTDIVHEGSSRHPNFDPIRELAQRTGARVTVSGGISGLEDLLKLQELEPYGIDSVVIGRALYENKFACQGIWRMCEAADYPYTAKV